MPQLRQTDIVFMTDDSDPAARLLLDYVREPVTGIQYAQRMPVGKGGDMSINRDQQWLRDGRGVEANCYPTYVRTVTITYGVWEKAPMTAPERVLALLKLLDISGEPEAIDELTRLLEDWRDER